MTIEEIQPDTHLPKEKFIKIYTALITQTATSAPVVTVLQNTLEGEIIWTRDSTGVYVGTLANAFPYTTTVTIQSINTMTKQIATGRRQSANYVVVESIALTTGALTDGLLSSNTLEIKVYHL